MLKLTLSKSRALSNICITIAQVFFGAFVAASVVLRIELGILLVVSLHLGLSVGFWILSLYFAEKGKL